MLVAKRIWQWLSKRDHQRTLGFLGAGLAAAAVGLWQAYVHFAEFDGAERQSLTSTIEAAGNATVIGRDLIDGITLAQHEAVLKEREGVIRAQLERDVVREAERTRLNTELETIKEERAHVEDELRKLKVSLGELAERVASIQEGDHTVAQELLDEVSERLREIEAESSDRAAEAAFQQGLLAERTANLPEAIEHYQRATRFAPENTVYRSAVEQSAEQRELPGRASAQGGEQRLSKEQIAKILSGNTAIGTCEGTSWQQYWAPDGTSIYVFEGQQAVGGKWKVTDDDLYMSWAWDNTPGRTYTFEVTGKGDRVTLVSEDDQSRCSALMVEGRQLQQ